MARHNLWPQLGGSNSMYKSAGPMCGNPYPSQNAHMQSASNLSSMYGMIYDQNMRQETSRASGSGHYLSSSQVGLSPAGNTLPPLPAPPAMSISHQQSYVGLSFPPYPLPVSHNIIHRPVAHVEPPSQNHQYFQGSPQNYPSTSSSRRVSPYQKTIRPDRRRAQESIRRGFELVRPEVETSRRTVVAMRNLMEPVASLSSAGMPQTPVVSVGATNGSMTVRQFLSSWRDRDEEVPSTERGGVNQNENFPIGGPIQTQSSSSLNPPQVQSGSTSPSFLVSNQDTSWVVEERRIERITNPDMIPLMYSVPSQLQQLQSTSQLSHLSQTESVHQLSTQSQLSHSSGIAPSHWQCLDIQSNQQCYGAGSSSSDFRSDDARPPIPSQRHYNINSSIETGEIFDDINGARDSRHRALQPGPLQAQSFVSRASTNAYSNEERHWDSIHQAQNMNFASMSGEPLGSHSLGTLVGGYFDSFGDPTNSAVVSSLRNEITPPPTHPDTTTRDSQETTERVISERPLSSEEINLSLPQTENVNQQLNQQQAQQQTLQQQVQQQSQQTLQQQQAAMCFPSTADTLVVHNDNQSIIVADDSNHAIQIGVLLDNNINTNVELKRSMANNNNNSNNNNNNNNNDRMADDVQLIQSPDIVATISDTEEPITIHDGNSSVPSINDLPVNENRLPCLNYSENSQTFDHLSPEVLLPPCSNCNQEEVTIEDSYPTENESSIGLPTLMQTLKRTYEDVEKSTGSARASKRTCEDADSDNDDGLNTNLTDGVDIQASSQQDLNSDRNSTSTDNDPDKDRAVSSSRKESSAEIDLNHTEVSSTSKHDNDKEWNIDQIKDGKKIKKKTPHIYCSLLWRRIFDENPLRLDLGRAKIQVKLDPLLKEWKIVNPQASDLHQNHLDLKQEFTYTDDDEEEEEAAEEEEIVEEIEESIASSGSSSLTSIVPSEIPRAPIQAIDPNDDHQAPTLQNHIETPSLPIIESNDIQSPSLESMVPNDIQSPSLESIVPNDIQSPSLESVVPNEIQSPSLESVVPNEIQSPSLVPIVSNDIQSPPSLVPSEIHTPRLTLLIPPELQREMNAHNSNTSSTSVDRKNGALTVSKTLLTVSHLVVKNDVTPIPNLVIKKTNTAYMSYLKNTSKKHQRVLSYLRSTERYKLRRNNGCYASKKSISIDELRSSQHDANVELHHCVLCAQSFFTVEDLRTHELTPLHRRFELIQRRAHHMGYYQAIGTSDPNVPCLSSNDYEFLVYLPNYPDIRNYYHHHNSYIDVD